MQKTKNLATFNRRGIALAVASALWMLAVSAQAADGVTTLAEYSLGQSSINPADPTFSQADPNSVDFSRNDGSTDNVFFHIYGQNSTSVVTFGSRASGNGNFAARGSFHLERTITNATSGALAYSFNYVIDSGDLQVACGVACDGGAGYSIAVSFGGHTVATGTGNLVLTSAGTSLTTSGIDLAGSASTADVQNGIGSLAGSITAFYSWSAAAQSASLGVLAPGQSKVLDYDLITTAYGNYGHNAGGSGYVYGYGGCEFECPGSSSGYSEARSGDPLSLAGIPDSVLQSATVTSISAVPEPSTAPLLLAGLAGLAVLSRRRRQR